MIKINLPVLFNLIIALLPLRGENPIIPGVYTADPSALVHGNTVYLYTGHDEPPEGQSRYVMKDWLCFSTTDMVHWISCGSPLAVKDFAWAKAEAWACDAKERNGKFYLYAPMRQKDAPGFGIGVAVADGPTGPFKDARGSALITHQMLPSPPNSWSNIDPVVFIDDDGQAYIFLGNTKCYYAKLKPDMTELDGEVTAVELSEEMKYVEAPWVHKRNGLYYLSFSSGFPEKTVYATSRSIHGPWTYRGILAEIAGNSNTIHHAIVDLKGQSFFIYHNGASQPSGGSFRRSVCVDYLYYNPDGSMKRVIQTTEGASVPAQP